MPTLDRFARRYGHEIDVERARARISAYVYGNILVLAAVVGATPDDVHHGHAAVLVLATTLTTYLAHVVAHAVGHAVGSDPAHPRERGEGLSELRDATPILSSGTWPALVLLVAWLAHLDPEGALAISAASVVLRLAGMGLLVARLSGRRPSARALWAGVVLAGVSVVIVALKVTLAH